LYTPCITSVLVYNQIKLLRSHTLLQFVNHGTLTHYTSKGWSSFILTALRAVTIRHRLQSAHINT